MLREAKSFPNSPTVMPDVLIIVFDIISNLTDAMLRRSVLLQVPVVLPQGVDYRLIASLNNHAITCIDNGKLGGAKQILDQAVKCTWGAPPMNGIAHPTSRTLDSAEKTATCTTANTNQPKELLSEVHVFIYQNGIPILDLDLPFFSESAPRPIATTTLHSTIVNGVVLFNLGLVHHLLGSVENRTAHLYTAHYYYSKSQMHLSSVGVFDTATGNADIDMLFLALYNNLAYINFELQRFVVSNQYFGDLIRFALSITPSLYPRGTLLDRQKSNVLLNAITLREPISAACA